MPVPGRQHHRAVAAFSVLLLIAVACTGPGEAPSDPGQELAEEVHETEAAEQVESVSEDVDDADPADDGVRATAASWLEDTYGLDSMILEGLEFAEVSTSPGVLHVRYAQTVDGVAIVGAGITVHVLDSGEIQSATDNLVQAQPGAAEPVIDRARAVDIAGKAVTGTVSGTPEAELVWVANAGILQLAYRVVVATVEPTSSWTVLVDAVDGVVLSADQATFGLAHHHEPSRPGGSLALDMADREMAQGTGSDACDVAAPGACVFMPDPIYAAGGDLPDPGLANDFLTGVTLQGLFDPTVLVGEFVDTEPAGVPIEPTREADSTWATGRAGRGFEAAMVYYWVDRVQRHIQALGFSGVLDEPFPVFPIDPGVVDNAFYSPAERAIHMGVGSDGAHEGEDASGIVHEYGHAVLDAQVPGLNGPGGGAYHEAFGDLFAYFTTLEHRRGDHACLFAWVEEFRCIRRVDTDKVYPDDVVNEVHFDGEIYSGAIHDVAEALLRQDGLDIDACPGTRDCNAVADRILTTLLASHQYLSNTPTLPDVAEAYLLANDAAFAGGDAQLIADAFAGHGLVGGGSGMVDPSGEAIGTSTGVLLSVDITHTYRGDLDIWAGVVTPTGEPLCDPIQLAAADIQDPADNFIGGFDVSGSACAAFVPPSAEQVWYLQAFDTLAADEGRINKYAVIVDDVAYLAPGLPVPIVDADPAGTSVFVGGVDGTVPDTGGGVSDTVAEAVPVVTLDITHTYLGDLTVTAGVVDATSTIVCSVPVLQADPSNNNSAGVVGDVDMTACAEFYPPSVQQRWYLSVVDTAQIDVGTVDQFTLTGPDGAVFDFADVPVSIPDADVDGVALLLDGSGSSSGQAGGTGASTGLPSLALEISHTYRGDLAVTAGALGADGNAACEVVLVSPDLNNPTDDLVLDDADLSECGRFYPPQPGKPWYVFVADTLTQDVGTILAASLTGPDGAVYTAAGLPIDVPDADAGGVLLTFQQPSSGTPGTPGTPGTAGSAAGLVVSAAITHSYIGDLSIDAGVLDAVGDVLCEVPVRAPDPQDSGQNLGGEVDLGECAAYYPPSETSVFFLRVTDHAARDEGTIDAFTVTGPDGQGHAAPGLPMAIPDDDPRGVLIGIFD